MRSSILILAVISIMILTSGCLVNEYTPKEGDLFLSIEMKETTFEPDPESIEVVVTLTNNCSETIMVDDWYGLGTTLFPRCFDDNGNMIDLAYDDVDRTVEYTEFEPGGTMVKTIELAGLAPFIEIDDEWHDFNWEIPGNYTLSFRYWGTKEPLEVRSNEIVIRILEE